MVHTVPAVVVGANLAALGIVRSLALASVPTFAVDTGHHRPAMRSRFTRPVIVPSLSGPGLVSGLMQLARRLETRPVLFVAEELSVPTISVCREELETAYRFRLPSKEMVSRLADKALFHRLAEQHGLQVPRSVVISTPDDFERLATLSCPVVIKPCDKMRVCEGQTDRIAIGDTIATALQVCTRMHASAGDLLVQEWIDGTESNIYFCLFYRGGGGDLVQSFVGRKISCYPPLVGSTAICGPAADHEDHLEALTGLFADQVKFDGMGSMEYKWDSTRRSFFAIEPTVARADWQEEIATLCGVNIPLAAYCHELQLPMPRAQPMQRLWRDSAARRLPQHLRTGHDEIVDGYWRRNDPLPAFFHYAGSLPRLVGERLRVGQKSASGLRAN